MTRHIPHTETASLRLAKQEKHSSKRPKMTVTPEQKKTFTVEEALGSDFMVPGQQVYPLMRPRYPTNPAPGHKGTKTKAKRRGKYG
jgi:hypothetical protein